MKLHDLNAEFTRVTEYDADGDCRVRHNQDELEGAQGVVFQCPLCAQGKEQGEETDDKGRVRRFVRGAHYVICWFRNPRGAEPVGTNVKPGPGRWWISAESTGIDDLTFVPGEPAMMTSVQLLGGCNWHGHVTGGDANIIVG